MGWWWYRDQVDPIAIQGEVKVGLDKADLRQREPVGIEHWMHFGHGVKENLRWLAWGLGRWWYHSPWGQVCGGGRTEVLGASHSWGRHAEESGGLERGLDCWLLAEKAFLLLSRYTANSGWSDGPSALICDCWLCQLDLLCPQAHTFNIPSTLVSFVFFPEENLQHAPQVRKKVDENKSFVKRIFTTSWFKEKR